MSGRSRKAQKPLKLQDIKDILNARFAKNEVHYLLDLYGHSQNIWHPHTNIASQTKTSQSFNDWIRTCDKIPSKLKCHKDLMSYSRNMEGKYIAFCLEVYVNNEASSMIMFPVQYDFCYFAGIQVGTIVKSILKRYKEKFDYLPIRPNGIVKNITDVCFVSFKYVLNCIQKTYIYGCDLS